MLRPVLDRTRLPLSGFLGIFGPPQDERLAHFMRLLPRRWSFAQPNKPTHTDIYQICFAITKDELVSSLTGASNSRSHIWRGHDATGNRGPSGWSREGGTSSEYCNCRKTPSADYGGHPATATRHRCRDESLEGEPCFDG
jgi:hypothetical protein